MMEYPYNDLSTALGRALTDDEINQAWQQSEPGTPGGGVNQDWPAPTPPTDPVPTPTPTPTPVPPTPEPWTMPAPLHGWDATKWADTSINNSKYAVGRIMAGFDPAAVRNDPTMFLNSLRLQGYNPTWNPRDLSVDLGNGEGPIDVITAGNEWWWGPKSEMTSTATTGPVSYSQPTVTAPVSMPAGPSWTSPVNYGTAPYTSGSVYQPTPTSGTNWSSLQLPESLTPSSSSTINAPAYVPPPSYGAPDYVPMSTKDLMSDPSYQFRFDQGQKALESSQAAKGITRTGGSMVDLVDYGQKAASQEYAAAEARRQAAWGLNFDASQAEYAPTLLGWQTKTAADQRNAELDFDRAWQQEIYNRDDAYRRMVFMADDNFRKVVYGTDDAFRKAVQAENDVWKRQVMEEERRRWLAELGAAQ